MTIKNMATLKYPLGEVYLASWTAWTLSPRQPGFEYDERFRETASQTGQTIGWQGF
jgi:hypothetical protein